MKRQDEITILSIQYQVIDIMAEIQKRELVTGETIYFSLVEKQSERGFSLNKRLFLMLENQFICYLSSPKLDFPLTLQHLSKNTKMVVPLNQISKISYLPKISSFEIMFWFQEQGKPKQKSWVLKMGSENLFQCWQQVFDEYSNRSRKGTLEQVNLVENPNIKGENINDPISRNGELYNNRNKTITKSNRQALQQQLNNSAHLLDPNESYFAHIHLVSPSPNKTNLELNTGSLKEKAKNLELSKLKGRSSYFSRYGGQPGNRVSFKNYYRPYFQDILKIDNSFLRYSQLEQLDRTYSQFVEYAQQQVMIVIDNKLKQIIQKEKSRLGYQGNSDASLTVTYSVLSDIIIEFGLIELQEVSNNAYVCDDSLNKNIVNNFAKLDYLYRIISRDPILRKTFFIPMGCVVYYKGFECLVRCKIDPQTDQEYLLFTQNSAVSSRELFEQLSQLSRISFDMFDDERNIQFVARNQRQDKFAIISAKKILPNLDDGLPVRKETFTSVFNTVNSEIYSNSKLKQKEESNRLKLTNRLIFKIKELSDLMNKLQIYPITPSQFSPIFHSFGLNTRHMSKIYSNLTHAYVRRIIKTEAALRAFKLIFRKKIQQTMGGSESSRISEIGRQLINMLLGTGQNSSDIWKVVSLHSQKYFNLSVESGQMIKGYLYLGLMYHLVAELIPAFTTIDSIFKVNNFIETVKFGVESKCSSILPAFLQDIQQDHTITMSSSLFKTIMKVFQLKDKSFPVFIQKNKDIHLKLMHLCAFYLKPKDETNIHLQLYGINVSNQISHKEPLDYFSLQRKLTEIRWEIKLGSPREHILLLLAKVKQSLQNYYNTYHPFISDICQLQSLYHLQLGQYELAVSLGRQSLSNMIQCCANNNQHIKISNSYYQIAEYLVQGGQIQQGLVNYRKAKHILQVNNYQKLPQYAHLLCKIGSLLLKQHREHDSHQHLIHALNIYQQHDPLTHWDAVVDLFQIIARSQPKPSPNRKPPEQDVHLAQICLTQLERALAVQLQFQLCSDKQFIRIMKIIIEYYFGKLKKEDTVVFRDYLIQLCDNVTLSLDQPHSLKESVLFFKSMVMQGSFATTIQNYVSHTGEVMSRRWTQQKIVKFVPRLQSDFIEGYNRFMRYLVELVGQPFFLNIIK